ncbi:tetratricopeptide repeat protein [Streptomyces sp. NPDC051940]|uniref:tetratricopeptide repeat protein n=1 Tax=Streptomyces sp. NPDC051940 TaxID=3155675 RepID=UPI00341F7D69
MAELSVNDAALRALGQAMRTARESRGLSQRTMARRLNSGHSRLSPYESGTRQPPAEVVRGYERVLGLPPGRLVRLLNRALGERTAHYAAPARELPPVPADFAGREAELARLRALTARAGSAPHPLVVVLHGMSGVGKTTLALRAAHEATRFAHQWWVELHRVRAGTRTPVAVEPELRRLLELLHIPPQRIPADPADCARLFRAEAEGHPLLLVLDDARDAAQVRPFIPGSGPALVVVTSLRPLHELAGAVHLPLGPLLPQESTALLAGIAGAQRLRAEPHAMEQVIAGCEGFPLSLRVLGERMAAQPHWPLSHFADGLHDRHERLSPLTAALTLSYRALDAGDRLLLRRLAHLPGTDVTASTAGVLQDLPAAAPPARRALERLAGAGLVTAAALPGRYRPHQLVREFAHERLVAEEDPGQREQTADRLRRWLLTTARQAAEAVAPAGGPFPGGRTAALDWLDAEGEAVLTVLENTPAEALAPLEPAALLDGLVWYYDLRCQWAPLTRAGEAVHRAALRLDDRRLVAVALNSLGYADALSGRPALAVTRHEQALELAHADGDWQEEAHALTKLGLAHWEMGRFADAVAFHRQDLAVRELHADAVGAATALSHLGHAQRMSGDPAAALATLRRALKECAAAGDPRAVAMTRWRLGMTLADLARWEEAGEQAREALAYFESSRDTWGPGAARLVLGRLHRGQGRPEQAAEELREAARVFHDTGDHFRRAQTLRALAQVYAQLGRAQEARACRTEARVALDEYGRHDLDSGAAEEAALLAQPASADGPEPLFR